MREHSDELGAIAQRWFEAMRESGDDVRELLHDGHCRHGVEQLVGRERRERVS